MTVSNDKQKYGVRLVASPNFRALGKRLRGDLSAVTKELKNMDDAALTVFQKVGKVTIKGHDLTEEDVELKYAAESGSAARTDQKYEAHSDGDVSLKLKSIQTICERQIMLLL